MIHILNFFVAKKFFFKIGAWRNEVVARVFPHKSKKGAFKKSICSSRMASSAGNRNKREKKKAINKLASDKARFATPKPHDKTALTFTVEQKHIEDAFDNFHAVVQEKGFAALYSATNSDTPPYLSILDTMSITSRDKEYLTHMLNQAAIEFLDANR